MNVQEKLKKFIETNELDFFTEQKLCELLEVSSRGEVDAIRAAMDAFVREGEFVRTKKNKFTKPENLGYQRGTIMGNARGFAFFQPDDRTKKDLFLPNRALHGAMHKDVVLVREVEGTRGSSDEGEVVSVLKRGMERIVGTYRKQRNFGFVVPDDTHYFMDVFIPKKFENGARSNFKVVVEITDYPRDHKNPEGKIVEVLGHENAVGADVLSVIKAHGLKTEFEKNTLAEAKRLPQSLSESDFAGREDFRKCLTFTIDGADARDLDDAISVCENEDGTFSLDVHIADVSHYVKERTALDAEALERATSVYFPDRVLPMLPVELSNGICSLHEGVDRFTLSVLMKVDRNGNVVDHRITEGVICSKKRLTYELVTKFLDGDLDAKEACSGVADALLAGAKLAKILAEKRAKRGSIDFEMPESKIKVDAFGDVIDVCRYPRELSNRMIEEFMILANETVAEQMFWTNLPFVYRVHDKPTEEKVDTFLQFLGALGMRVHFNAETLRSKMFREVLNRLEGDILQNVVNRVMLRSMQKAKYSPENVGHFGLASTCYCHFTSPIRRYPDLMIHRIIKKMLAGSLSESEIARLNERVAEVSSVASEREQIADLAERDADDLKKAEFMIGKEGELFEGVISGVTSFGVFVELENTIEGLIRIDSLPPDDYNYDERMFTLRGRKRTFRLGDRIAIEVASVNLETAKVEFYLADPEEETL